MKILHIVPGTSDVSNGMVVVARLLAKEQGDAEVVDLNAGLNAVKKHDVEEVWVHGMWLPKEWRVCQAVLRSGKRLVRMTHGSLSPVYLTQQGPLKKKLVSPIERYFLRRVDRVVATCEAEADWIRAYLGHRCPPVEVTDIKRFFNLANLNLVNPVNPVQKPLHLLYLGRRHPLKGLNYLEAAVKQLQPQIQTVESRSDLLSTVCKLQVVSNAFGDELEKVWNWCDVLVLPTLSENFGLVIAEALERGKRVITTDGAPAWGGNLSRVEVERWREDGRVEGGEILFGYNGRLIYLNGYRDGSSEKRIELLRDAIKKLAPQGIQS